MSDLVHRLRTETFHTAGRSTMEDVAKVDALFLEAADELERLQERILELEQHLSCMMDYASEGGAGKMVGFRHAYTEALEALNADPPPSR